MVERTQKKTGTEKKKREKQEQIRQSNRTNVVATATATERQSDRHTPQPRQLPTTIRDSDRTPPTTTQPVTIDISDGPAPSRIRTANQYQLGDTIPLHYTITQGTAAHIICRVQQPDGTTAEPSSGMGNANYQTTQPGQHWYAFDAYDDQGNRLASAEAIFLVAPQHVTR